VVHRLIGHVTGTPSRRSGTLGVTRHYQTPTWQAPPQNTADTCELLLTGPDSRRLREASRSPVCKESAGRRLSTAIGKSGWVVLFSPGWRPPALANVAQSLDEHSCHALVEAWLFAGDRLANESYGREDFPGRDVFARVPARCRSGEERVERRFEPV
jgi:hypothetical protein